MTTPTCDRCGRKGEGFATIGDRRLCHPDYGHSCYQEEGLLFTWTAPHLKAAALAAASGSVDLGGMSSVEYVRRLRDEW